MSGNNGEIASLSDVRAQNAYINRFVQTDALPRDYRCELGFTVKKVLFGHREHDRRQQVNAIELTFSIHDFNCSDSDRGDLAKVQNTNFVQIGPIIIPNVTEGQLLHQEIIDYCKDNEIFGTFLCTNNMRDDSNPQNERLFYGRLYVILYARFLLPNASVGVITAVFPYYEYRDGVYKIYLELDHRDRSHFHQTRLTSGEVIPGIHEMNYTNAVDTMLENIRYLHQESTDPNSAYSYSAIYVGKYATLALMCDNDESDEHYDRFRRKFPKHQGRCHERILIQHGGLVGLQRYKLSFQFMDSLTIHHSLQALRRTGIPVTDNSDMSTVKHPLIVLESPSPPIMARLQGLRPHFASYGLRVRNNVRGKVRKATLQLPTWARFQTVRELSPDVFDPELTPISSNAYRHVIDLWNPQPYKDSTGPYLSADPNGIAGQTRSAFPNGEGEALSP